LEEALLLLLLIGDVIVFDSISGAEEGENDLYLLELPSNDEACDVVGPIIL